MQKSPKTVCFSPDINIDSTLARIVHLDGRLSHRIYLLIQVVVSEVTGLRTFAQLEMR